MIAAIEAAGHAVSRLLPQRLRQFALADGQLAKTDRADAHLLTLYGRLMRPPGQRATG